MDDKEVRRIAALVDGTTTEQKEARDLRRALADEYQAYQAFINGPASGQGWTTCKHPLHRLEADDAVQARAVKHQAEKLPAVVRIVKWGGMEWVQHRPLDALTDEEINSTYETREAYERAVAQGKCNPRYELDKPSSPDQEPTGGERYQMHRAILERWNSAQGPVAEWLGLLLVALKDASPTEPLLAMLERQFRWRHEADRMHLVDRLERMAEVVPQLNRLVTWVRSQREAA